MFISIILYVSFSPVCVCQCVLDRLVGGGLELVELAEGVSLEDLRASTGASFQVNSALLQ